MFRSLGLFNYRVWFIGALVSNIGGWMQSTAQDWVVLTELTHNDATAMGVTMALQFGPPLVLVSITGWVADHFDRRKLLMCTQTALGLLAITVGVLLLTHVMTLPMMWLFAGLFGVANAFDSPARQAFVSDVVSRENAANAVALNSASFNTARLIGPAVGGVMIVLVGTGWMFIVNAATFLAMLFALTIMRQSELQPRVRATDASRLADGFRYVAGRPDLIVLFVMVFLIGAFGMNFAIFASTMALEFGLKADGYGALSSMLAIGSLAGALMAARRDRARLRVVIVAAGGFGVTSLVSSAMPVYWMYGAVIVFVGFSTVSMLTTANGYVQTTTAPHLRGRVLALYMAVIMGSTPIGAPIAGWVATTFGARAAIQLGAAAGIIACVIGAVWLVTSGRLHRSEERRFALTIDETRPISVVAAMAPEEFSDEIAQTTPIPITDREAPLCPTASETAVSPTGTTKRRASGGSVA
ncbi:MFS transporter [Microbacterium terrisoli]|uniref:MFS transporter n=1 Tax=Microbacterium terrisoli TaxID=3242192 RepID=UPI002804D381|nr:MFS transporter [Microbacterium protaetiae]